MLYGLKSSRRSFSKYLWKKILENDSNVEEYSDYQKMSISWELPEYGLNYLFPNNVIPTYSLLLFLLFIF